MQLFSFICFELGGAN